MKPQSQQKIFTSPLEALREGASETQQVIKKEIIQPFSQELLDQMLGRRRKQFSGELMPNDSLELKEVYRGERAEKERYQKQIILENQLRREEEVLVKRKGEELSIQIQAINEEVVKIAQITPNLSREIELASFQSRANPSFYELFFIRHILKALKDFRKNAEDASLWLATANNRASKQNVWLQNFKAHGAKYLLSGEHYSNRSPA